MEAIRTEQRTIEIYTNLRNKQKKRAFPAMKNVAIAGVRFVFLSVMTGHDPFLQYVHARGALKWDAPHSPLFPWPGPRSAARPPMRVCGLALVSLPLPGRVGPLSIKETNQRLGELN